MKYALIKDCKITEILEGSSTPDKGENDEVIDITNVTPQPKKGDYFANGKVLEYEP